jgi:phosphoenolpyruvate carboxykinase (ATP)
MSNSVLSFDVLAKESIALGLARQTPEGALLVETGKHTGRAVDSRFIVSRPDTHSSIDWGKVNKPLEAAWADQFYSKLQKHLETKKVYTYRGYVGILPIEVVTVSPWHAAFCINMFRKEKSPVAVQPASVPTIRIFHDPSITVSDLGLEFSQQTLIAVDPSLMQVGIVGTGYAGEIKKSAFTLSNYKMPEYGIFPMHASANTQDDGARSSVLFGLSGTGKTTLSADPLRALIGDDEILWSQSGLSNLEGGCYAKLIDLDPKKEPDIYEAVNRPHAIQENVVVDQASGKVDFANRSKTENTRGSYPLTSLKRVFDQNREASAPSSIIFLTADAFGALPAVAKLSPQQAQFYFLAGYTAKVAGTELGVKEPQAAFSPCFGAPFMPRRPVEYARLLKALSDRAQAQVWLLNTGWMEGGYGKADRYPIPVSRRLLTAIQTGELEQSPRVKHPVFGFEVPTECPGIDTKFLKVPEGQAVRDLAEKFQAQAKTWGPDVDPEIIEWGSPRSSSSRVSAAGSRASAMEG